MSPELLDFVGLAVKPQLQLCEPRLGRIKNSAFVLELVAFFERISFLGLHESGFLD